MIATFSSNKIKILKEKLKKDIFFNSNNLKQIVFVENTQIKNWLVKSFCDDPDINVFWNIEIININQISKFLKNIGVISKKSPNFLEISLLVQKEIHQILEKYDILEESEKSIFLYLKNYLKKDEKYDKRLSSLSFEITKMFIDYSIYKKKNDSLKKQSWQIFLFNKIFKKENYLILCNEKKLNINLLDKYSLCFFGLDFLPRNYYEILIKCNNVNFYLLSPCMFFWEDLVSDKERKYLQKTWTQKNVNPSAQKCLEELIKDRNSFLANQARLGRNFLKIINDYENNDIFDQYDSLKVSKTILEHLKMDLLYLKSPHKKDVLFTKDSSIQLHISISKLREIEILKDNVLSLIKKGYQLSDIHVMSFDIDQYAPFINVVFNKEDKINYKISNLKTSSNSFLIHGIKIFYSLVNKQENLENFIELIENPLLQNKFKINPEEVLLIRKWLKDTKISSFINEKNTFYDSSVNSLKKGLERLLNGLIYKLDKIPADFNDQYPYEGIEFSQVDLLNKLIAISENIEHDITFLKKYSLTLDKWAYFFKYLIDFYFKINDDLIEQSACKSALHLIKELLRASKTLKKQTFASAYIFKVFFRELDSKKSSLNTNLLDAIHFSSFEMSAIPAKAIFLIGLNGSYPQVKIDNSLNNFSNNEKPLEIEKDRYNFLKAVLSANDYLVLSYSSVNYKDDKSLILQEFLNYLDASYLINKKMISQVITTIHPAVSFHKNYYSAEDLYSFSQLNYLACQKHYNEKVKAKVFLQKDAKANKDIPEHINIKDLSSFANNPIKFYFNKILNIYLDQEDKFDYNFSFLKKFIIQKESLFKPLKEIFAELDKKGEMPHGIFKEIAIEKVKKDNQRLLNFLEKENILKKDIYKLILSRNCTSKVIEKNIVTVPAIELNIENKKVCLYGTIDNISKEGLIIFSDDKLSSIVKIWPKLLIFLYFSQDLKKQVIFTKNQKIRKMDFNHIGTLLLKYVQFYLKSFSNPSFLIKDLSQTLLQKNRVSLEADIYKLINQKSIFEDLYIKKVFAKIDKSQIAAIYETSQNLRSIFQPILEEA